MAGTGFGVPNGLLTVPSVNPSSSASVSMLPVPPPPPFAGFKFQTIGQQPGLLKRFSETGPTREPTFAETESPSERDLGSNPDAQDVLLPSRPSLWQALAENDSAFASDPPIDHTSSTTQRVTGSSIFPPTMTSPQAGTASTVSNLRNLSTNFQNGGEAPPTMTSPQAGTASTVSNLRNLSTNFQNGTASPPQENLDSLGLLGYPDPGPTSHPAPERNTENRTSAQSTGRTVARSASPKLEELRHIRSQIQDHLLNLSSPNLSSAIVLTQSIQTQAAAVVTEARQNLSFAQETFHNAQKSLTAAQKTFTFAKEVQDSAESAKAEVDRLSEKESTRRATELGKIRELLQSLDNWISERETAAQARAELVKQKKEELRAGHVSNRSSVSVNASPPSIDSGTHAKPPDASEKLFLSPTPEVETKFATQLREQSHARDIREREEQIKRQTVLRRLEEERRRASAEAESSHPLPAPMEVDRGERQRSEELRKRMAEVRMQEKQRQKEVSAQQQVESRRREEEEKMKREEAKKREEAERKAREAAKALKLKKAQEEAERKANEIAAREAQEEAKKKAEEEAERKAQEEEKRRQEQEKKKALEREQLAAFLEHQKRTRENEKREAEEARLRLRQEEQKREERMLQENARLKAEKEREREIQLRQQQEIRRQQIQNDKNKTMADRALQIRTEREQRLRLSLDTNVDDMSLESSPTAPAFPTALNPSPTQPPTLASAITISHPASSQTVPSVGTGSSMKPPSLPKRPPCSQSPATQDLSSLNAAPMSNIGSQQGVLSNAVSTPPTRQISLPPVAHYSPPKSPMSLPLTPETPRISVHRQSGDAGNLPFHKETALSPQSQAANLRHVVNALQLPPLKFSIVKQEPAQESSLLLPGSEISTTTATYQSQVNIQIPPNEAASATVRDVSSSTAVLPHQPSLPMEPSNDLRSNGPSDLHIPLSSTPNTVTNAAPRPESETIQKHQLPQNVSREAPPTTSTSSEIGVEEARPQKFVPANGHSRSTSPFRMGPDTYVSPLPTEMHSEISLEPRGPSPPRGRPGNTYSQRNWDHYSPPRSPPPRNIRQDREMDTYKPYQSRPASPIPAVKKRSRELSPPPPARIRDYRDYDDRRPPAPPPAPQPRRHSRSPPRRVRRLTPPPQRSQSPYQNRPPLASRLTQGTANESRPPSPPREPKGSRPELLDRFNEPNLNIQVPLASQPSKPIPTRPSGKRGGKSGKHGKRGGRGGVIIGAPSHASLEQRISSGTTLINRLEEPPR